jgi:NAD(P)H-dependent FMN reductase
VTPNGARGQAPERSRIGVVVGTTRPGRRGAAVARWVRHAAAAHRPDVAFVLLDIASFALPLLDEPCPPATGVYRHAHTKAWSDAVAACQGFVFVTPEYNRSIPAALKNAVDYLHAEWQHKAAGFVSYGVTGGWRAAEALRLVLAELRVADVRTAVGLCLGADFAGGAPAPAAHHHHALRDMVDEVVAWSAALAGMRQR